MTKSIVAAAADSLVDDATLEIIDPDFSEFDPFEVADYRDADQQLAPLPFPEWLDPILATAESPFDLVVDDMASLTNRIKELLGTEHDGLSKIAQYFFEEDGGKKVRPSLVTLVSLAINQHLSPTSTPGQRPINRSQQRLAEITELIHTASLLHDDVIDVADMRRGRPTVNIKFGNKLAILGGDFFLARASVNLARLRNVEVIELLSTVIEHLVKGEIIQLRGLSGKSTNAAFELYQRKNYYKTASLIANSCKAAVMLGCDDEDLALLAFNFGKHLGLAFQLIDDALDFDGSSEDLGKPTMWDLSNGIATAPVLFAAHEYPEVTQFVDRKFEGDDDVERVLARVIESDGVLRTRNLARFHVIKAMEEISSLKPSRERDSLFRLAKMIVDRSS